jgi:hypothetical protein
MRRGLVIAQDSGTRYNETHLASILGRLEARHGDPLAALDYLELAIRNYHDSGNSTVMRVPAWTRRTGRDHRWICVQSHHQIVDP